MIYTRIKNKLTRMFSDDKRVAQPVPAFRASYSQHGEDLIVQHLMRVLNIQQPFFVDAGAYHPYILNNTFLFIKKEQGELILSLTLPC